MSTTTDHRIETSGSMSLALADGGVQGADVKSMTVSPNGPSRELLEDPTVSGKARYTVTRSHARRNLSKRSRQVDRSKCRSGGGALDQLAVRALSDLGFREEAQAFRRWLRKRIKLKNTPSADPSRSCTGSTATPT